MLDRYDLLYTPPDIEFLDDLGELSGLELCKPKDVLHIQEE